MTFGLTGFLNSPDLHGVFGLVCGQNPEHTWMPAGILLPCCQRCLGLYVGAALALLLRAVLRPKLTGRFLELHGAFLLLMVPLGFHWAPQGPVLRTVSGLLFGAGVATFLWLPLAEGFACCCVGFMGTWQRSVGIPANPERGHSCPQELTRVPQRQVGARLRTSRSVLEPDAYFVGLVACAVLLPLLASQSGQAAALVLTVSAVAGLVLLSALSVSNLLLALGAAARLVDRVLRSRIGTSTGSGP